MIAFLNKCVANVENPPNDDAKPRNSRSDLVVIIPNNRKKRRLSLRWRFRIAIGGAGGAMRGNNRSGAGGDSRVQGNGSVFGGEAGEGGHPDGSGGRGGRPGGTRSRCGLEGRPPRECAITTANTTYDRK